MIKLSSSTLNLVEECERCFWYQTKGVPRPGRVYPSVLNAMDRLIKLDTARRVKRGERLSWAGPAGTIVTGAGGKLTLEVGEMRLTGMLDELVKTPGGYKLIDYKSAAKPYDREKAAYWYTLQLSAYALLCEANGYSPVIATSLVFYTPKLLSASQATFDITEVPVPVDTDRVWKVLKRAEEISKMSVPPETSCEYCRYTEKRNL